MAANLPLLWTGICIFSVTGALSFLSSLCFVKVSDISWIISFFPSVIILSLNWSFWIENNFCKNNRIIHMSFWITQFCEITSLGKHTSRKEHCVVPTLWSSIEPTPAECTWPDLWRGHLFVPISLHIWYIPPMERNMWTGWGLYKIFSIIFT